MSREIVNVLLEPADLKLLKRFVDTVMAIDENEGVTPMERLGFADRERAAGLCGLLDSHIKWHEKGTS